MPQRSDAYHGGSGWRFTWRPDRMQRLHELGQAFELTEDREVPAAFDSDDAGEPTSTEAPIVPEASPE